MRPLSGWQELDFSSPVAVTAGTTYVASYHTSTGHYARHRERAGVGGDQRAADRAGQRRGLRLRLFEHLPVEQLQRVELLGRRGVLADGGQHAAGGDECDAGSGVDGHPVSVAPTATFSQPVVPSTVSFTLKDSGGNTVAGTVGFNGADTVATFTPDSSLAAGTTYTATVSGAQNTSGTPMSSPFSWSFTTGAVAQCPCSIWQDGAPPGAVDADDTSAVDLGVQFQAASSGYITGVRFYKEADNTGTHTGSLWTSTGTLLATGDVQQRDRQRAGRSWTSPARWR